MRALGALRRTVWLTLIVALAGVRPLAAQRETGGFVLEGREDGVSVWNSPRGRSSLGTFKVVTQFAVPAPALLMVLRDIPSYPRWYRDCLKTQVLRAPAQPVAFELEPNGRFVRHAVDEHYRLLFVQHVPWMSDRFAVIENDVRVRNDGALEIAFRSREDDPTKGPEGTVRMRLSGVWLFRPLDRARTEVSYVLDLDLDTGTPDFLVAPRVRDAARGTLLALGRVAAARARAAPRTTQSAR